MYKFLLIIGLIGLVNSGCVGCENIEPGHVGVLVKKCSGGGIQEEPLGVGWQTRNLFCEEIKEYPTYQSTLVLSKDEAIVVNSSEGLPIKLDVSLSLTLDPKKVPKIYAKYRNELDMILHSYVKQAIREGIQETAAKYTAEQLYSTKRAETRAEVQEFLKVKLGSDGFHIEQFVINELQPPAQVVEAINSKVAMVQQALKAEQEVKKTEAEAKQAVARAEGQARSARAEAEGQAASLRVMADAESYYNQKVSSSITSSLVQMKAIEKWNGVTPQVSGTTGTPFINVK